MATVNFLYRSIRDSSPITLRLLYRYDGIDLVHSAKTSCVVTKEYWNKQHNRKRIKDIDQLNKQTDIKNELEALERTVLKKFYSTSPELVNKSWLKNVIEDFYNPKSINKQLPTDLLHYFDHFLELKKREISLSSIKRYSVVRNLLSKFINHRKASISIIDFDLALRHEFEKYCYDNQYAVNTVAWALRTLKTVCNHARQHGLETSRQLDLIKTKTQQSQRIYLNDEELDRIGRLIEKDLTDHLINARDWLIISCFTGQRVSDFMRFSKGMIRVEKGKSLLEFKQQKTGKLMTIPLHKKVLKILGKRNGEFPRAISSQKYNEYIKKVCELANIKEPIKGSRRTEIDVSDGYPFRNETGTYEKWQLVTSHIGRRSFATNFYGKIPTSFLIYVTGHSTEQMFLNYIGKSNKDIAIELTKYF